MAEGAERQIVLLQDACRSLAEARTIDEVKLLRDKAQAIHHYLKQQNCGLEAQNKAAEFKIRAERRLGELLIDLLPEWSISHDVMKKTKEVGIEPMQSHRWQKMAAVPAEVFEQHLAELREADRELTTAGVLRLARTLQQPGKQEEPPLEDACTVESLEKAIESGVKFRTIYADPPWQYGNQGTRAATDNHYRTMPVEDIAALRVKELAADSAHLHLWTTNAFLPEAFLVMEAWGFDYKSVFVWCKPIMGLGNYWRVAHEFLLLGVRGNCPFRNRAMFSWQVLERGEHSSKPREVRKTIERVSFGPRLEMFARHESDGWVTWGNQIGATLFDAAIKEALSFAEEEVVEEEPSLFPGEDEPRAAGVSEER